MNEIWKDIDGYNGKYQISNFGNVRIPSYIDKRTDFIMSVYLSIKKTKKGITQFV